MSGHPWSRPVLAIWVALCIQVHCGAGDNLPRKKLAGPPSEFELHRLPQPSREAQIEHAAQYSVALTPPTRATSTATASASRQNGTAHALGHAWTGDLMVDSDQYFAFSLFIPSMEDLVASLHDPNGKEIDLARHATRSTFPLSSSGGGVEVDVFQFVKPVVGVWNLQLHWKAEVIKRWFLPSVAAGVKSERLGGLVVVHNTNSLALSSHVTSFSTLRGSEIGLVSGLRRQGAVNTTDGIRNGGEMAVVAEAMLDVTFPDGRTDDIPMHDDGLLGDVAPNDGDFTASFKAEEKGIYHLRSMVKGKSSGGAAFMRVTHHLVTVVEPYLELDGSAWMQNANVDDASTIDIALGVRAHAEKVASEEPLMERSGEGEDEDERVIVRAYAEVMGKGVEGKDVPVAWVGGLVAVEKCAVVERGLHASSCIHLSLDKRWLQRAGAAGPLVLRNVYATDVRTSVPLTERSHIKVSGSQALLGGTDKALEKLPPIDRSMRMGVPPVHLRAQWAMRNDSRTIRRGPVDAGEGKLVLVHGYCSDENPFEKKAQDFTNPAFFLNAGASVSNDEFARLIASFAADFHTYALVAHSQGGLAGTHLLNYYWTSLDNAPEGRLLQSVGSPYLGNSVAGTAADIGKVFGVGCGANTDLTRDGAAAWLAGITSETRKHVWFYRTVYPDKLFASCSLAAQLVLKKPNDGVAELFYTMMDGANDGGVKDSWCHSPGMNYPSQCTDSERNQEMNEKAGR